VGCFVTNFISGKENKAYELLVAAYMDQQHEAVDFQTLPCIWKEQRWDIFLNLGVPAACESPVQESMLNLLQKCMCVCTQGYEKAKQMSSFHQTGRKI